MSLLPHQQLHALNLEKSLVNYNRALDASDTGTGKTYTAIYLAQKLKLKPFIICPKSVIPAWFQVMKDFGITPLGIANYELVKNCRYYTHSNLEKRDCPFMDKKIIEVTTGKRVKKKKKKNIYFWNLPMGNLIIFDESHKCKNDKTINSDLLFSLSHQPLPLLMLSATACDKPKNFKLFGYVLGLYPTVSDYHHWISEADEGHEPMQGVHRKLFPDYASRMRIRDIEGDIFQENKVVADCLKTDQAKEIEEQYALIEKHMEDLKKKEDRSCALGQIIRARMRIEMLKLPIFLTQAKQHLEAGKAVAIFVNFTATLEKLSEQLKTTCRVFGEQTMEERTQAIADFNADRERVIILNIMAGGVGISLHDQHGNYPRVSLISPTWSAQDLLQALGRIHRAKAKTEAEQHIIYCAGTIEERICKKMTEKIHHIGHLNDGDVESYGIEGMIKTKGTSDQLEELSDFEKMFQQINTLHARKKRLTEELAETDRQIKSLEASIGALV